MLCLLKSLDQRSPIIFWRVFHCLLRVLSCETVSQSFFAQGFIKACAEGDLKYHLVWTLNLKSSHSKLKSFSCHLLDLFLVVPSSTPKLFFCKIVGLLLVAILNLLTFLAVVLKSPKQEWSLKYLQYFALSLLS